MARRETLQAAEPAVLLPALQGGSNELHGAVDGGEEMKKSWPNDQVARQNDLSARALNERTSCSFEGRRQPLLQFAFFA